MNLNLGCGANKITSAVNVDINPDVNPDIVASFTEVLPFPDASAEEVYLFHTIEHISKKYHAFILDQIRRVLKDDGVVIISYPEFAVIAQYWLENHRGMRDFWEKALYGRQLYPSDTHVALMNTDEFTDLMQMVGFKDIHIGTEPEESYNTIVKAKKGIPMKGYEELLYEEVIA